jgi:hypothetical protein
MRLGSGLQIDSVQALTRHQPPRARHDGARRAYFAPPIRRIMKWMPR